MCPLVSRDHDLDTVGVTGSIPVSPTLTGPGFRGLLLFRASPADRLRRPRAALGPQENYAARRPGCPVGLKNFSPAHQAARWYSLIRPPRTCLRRTAPVVGGSRFASAAAGERCSR